ncbi:MAG: ABC transporter permease [Bacteroides sp.]|nr:ABC transporter permease [Prevotella sp.]MCM1407647.1 ABC transporter permease [Treponema brennaborense]MCM1469203.1 ABC transporter permease [Bacteroides sp.]
MKAKNYNMYAGIFSAALLALLLAYAVFFGAAPNDMNLSERFAPPSIRHIFGTDNFGRDILSRSAYGLINSLLTALFAVAFGGAVGTAAGASASWFGGIFDEICMRCCDIIKSFPGILVALVIVSAAGAGLPQIICALGILFVPVYARVIRGCYLAQQKREYVQAAALAGAGPFRIMFVHILPNIVPELLSAAATGFAQAMLSEAALSFLGLGIQPPDASLGRMLSEAQSNMLRAPWMCIFPGTVIVLAVFCFYSLSAGLARADYE